MSQLRTLVNFAYVAGVSETPKNQKVPKAGLRAVGNAVKKLLKLTNNKCAYLGKLVGVRTVKN